MVTSEVITYNIIFILIMIFIILMNFTEHFYWESFDKDDSKLTLNIFFSVLYVSIVQTLRFEYLVLTSETSLPYL